MKGKLSYLTFSFIILLLLYPYLETGIGNIILNIIMSVTIFSGVYAVGHKRKNLVIALLLGVPWFVLNWIDVLIYPSPIIKLISSVFFILFFVFSAVVIFQFVLKSVEVSKDVLYGAVCVYMLIGGIWFAIYTLLYSLQPGSFYAAAAVSANSVLGWSDLLYYSFATLTTLGYGDIVPVTSHARSLAILEAIIGVLYLAIIIGRLVGMYITQGKEK